MPVSQRLGALLVVTLTFVTSTRQAAASSADKVRPKELTTVSSLTQRLGELGLIDVKTLSQDLRVALAHTANLAVLGADLYGGLTSCYLRREAAEKLARAAALLQARRPELRLELRDCLRPRDVQRRMWALVVGTPLQGYIANPATGSMHNYGVAVDITLASADGEAVDMGTPVHYFGKLAEPRHEERFLAEGKLDQAQLDNRRLLREVMLAAGFRMIRNEWWHFEAFDPKSTRQRFAIIESFDEATLSQRTD